MNEWIEKIQQLNWKQADRAAPILLFCLFYICAGNWRVFFGCLSHRLR